MENLKYLKSYLENENTKKEFMRIFMYILNVGNGDGLTESNEYINDKLFYLDKLLKENTILPILFFYDINSINEKLKCLENSIDENK